MDAAAERGWMRRALALAQQAAALGEVPVGAVIVKDGECLAEGWNQTITARDPSAHAEIVALRAAAQRLGNHRLPGAAMYVTLEPCAMCAGAVIQARIQRLAYAAADPAAGAAGSVFNVLQCERLNHRVELRGGLLGREAAELLRGFFQERRRGLKDDGRAP